jgi:hypothetical protein
MQELFGVEKERVAEIEKKIVIMLAEFRKNKEFRDEELADYIKTLTKEEAFIAGMCFMSVGNSIMYFEAHPDLAITMSAQYYKFMKLVRENGQQQSDSS